MANGKDSFIQEESTVISIIQSVKDGTRNPKTLSETERQGCVEFLSGEGYTQVQIGQILKVTDRTVRRDLREVENKNALNPDINLAKRIIGDMFHKAIAHHRYLMRLARSPEASITEKGQSEFLAWRVLKEMTERMASMGYLPSKPQAIVGNILHHVDGKIENLDELAKQIIEIEKMTDEDSNVDKNLKKDLNQMKTVLKKIRPQEDGDNKKEGSK